MTNSVTQLPDRSPVPQGAELIRPATKRELQPQLEMFFRAFSGQHQSNPAPVAAVYVMVLSEFSAWSIKEGLHRLIAGKVEGVDRTWLPSTAVVAHTIRSIANSSPEAKEREWRRRLDHWRNGKDWNPHWGQDPEAQSFPFVCLPHLVEDFAQATAARRSGGAA